jgi:uncharacterized protein (DUF1800 family)
MYSERERTAHVVRRLGVGANPTLVTDLGSPADAISRMLDLSGTPTRLPGVETPPDWDSVDYDLLPETLLPWWMETIASGHQPLTERLVWFWHDHFAVSGEKVDNSYVLWKHHQTVRDHATGNFGDMLHAVTRDPAMLWYLDATQNSVESPNENLGRELMELHTLGVGNYTQEDVRDISRALTGWVINEPHWEEDRFVYPNEPPWSAVLEPERFDSGTKTLLGMTGNLDLDGAVDVLLDQPETGQHVAAKLYRELVGLDPDPATIQRLGKKLAQNYDILTLVEEIVTDPAFLSDEAIRAKIRTPLEKAASVLQGLPRSEDDALSWLHWVLAQLHYLPLHAPNPAGFPRGEALLDPARMLGSFQLLYLSRDLDEEGAPAVDPLAALGLYDVSTETRTLIDRFARPGLQMGLAFGSPEFMVV